MSETTKSGIDITESAVYKKMLSLSNPAAKEWFNQRRQSVRPWSDFVNSSAFKKPQSVKSWTKRGIKNIEHYQTNYFFVFIILIVYCIVTSPLLLIAISVFLGACYIIQIKNAQEKIKVMGRELSYAQQYALAAAFSFPLFFIAGAGSAVFWVLGVSFFAIGLHASFHVSENEESEIESEPFMETV